MTEYEDADYPLKTKCDTRRCRKAATHKHGMFNFCDEHYKEMCVINPEVS